MFVHLGWLRVISALLSFAIVHYWAFVLALPGGFSRFADSHFFWQFQEFFLAHLAFATAATVLYAYFVTLAVEGLEWFGFPKFATRILRKLCSMPVCVVVYCAIFLVIYLRINWLKEALPKGFYGGIWSVLVPLLLILLLLFAAFMSFFSEKKAVDRGPENAKTLFNFGAVFGLSRSVVLGSAVIISVVAIGLGFARAKSMHLIGTSFLKVEEECCMELRVIGATGQFYVALDQTGDLIMLNFDQVQSIYP